MWLMKNAIMNDFAAEVKKGKYKKIDYPTWRELKESPDDWEIDIECNLYNYSEENSSYATISWDGCEDYPYEFSINDGSLGEYIKTLFDFYNDPLGFNSSTFYNAIDKASEAAAKAGVAIRNAAQACNWTASNSNDRTATSISNNFYEKQPTVEISEKGLKINGQSLNEIIDDVTGVSIRKENDNMNLFKGFNFGSCENDNVKMSIYGIAVKNANGTWVSYDPKTESVVDVDILNFDAKYLYKMPVAIKDVKVGDTIIHCRKPMFVTSIDAGKLLVIDPAAGEEKVVLLTKSMFGFDFVTKVVNLFGNCFNSASEDQPFGNMLPLMLLADGGKENDMLPLVFAMNGGKFDMSNPMMLYFLTKDNKTDNMLPLMFAMNGNLFGSHECKCEGCSR